MPSTTAKQHAALPLPLWEEAALHRDRLLGWARKMTRDRDVAESAVQDTLLQAWKNGHTLRSRKARWSWLWRVLRNQVLSAHRRERKGERVLPMGSGEFDPVDGSQAVLTASTEPLPATPPCISSLPDHYRDVLTSVYVEGMTIREFSESRGLTLNNARVRLYRARKGAREGKTKKAPAAGRRKPPPATPRTPVGVEDPDDREWVRFARAVATAFDASGRFDTTTAEFTPRELRRWALSLLAATKGETP